MRLFVAGLIAMVVLAGTMAAPCQAQMPKSRELDRERDEAVREFAARVRRIALQYEQAGDREKARSMLRFLLQAVPGDAEAKALLDRISRQELTENKTVVKVFANQSWQNTGVQVVAGKPVVIEAKGTWVFRMNRTVTAEGIEVPEDMKSFPLGSLLGVIEPVAESVAATSHRETKSVSQTVDEMLGMPPIDSYDERDSAGRGKKSNQDHGPRPFLVGSRKVFTPSATGTLHLKIHDSNEADNSGELVVTISGQIRVQPGSAAHMLKPKK